MKYIASVSFGKDSLAMLLKIIEENLPLDEVVFYDTGMEFQAIYNIRDKIKTLFYYFLFSSSNFSSSYSLNSSKSVISL